jgi:hypothetical protein
VSGEYENSGSKEQGLFRSAPPKKQNSYFLVNGYNEYDNISIIYEDNKWA